MSSANINIPAMIPLEELRERKKQEEQSGKTFFSKKRTESKTKEFRLLCVDGIYAGAEFPLDSEIIMGRVAGEASIIYPADAPGISRMHCSIRAEKDGKVVIKDLGSSQGTFFADGTKLKPNVAYRIKKGECFYLASKKETYKLM